MVLHNAHVVCYLRDKLGHYGWYDQTLEADHWTALSDIAPIDAAMLLCQINPNTETFEHAKQATTGELKPEHIVRLAQRLVDIDKAEHRPRTLREWHQKARELGLKYESWIDGYMEATTLPTPPVADTTTPAPVGAAKRNKKKPSIESVAFDYMRNEYQSAQFQSAAKFHKHLIKTAGLEKSPFEMGTGTNARKLFCPAASSFFEEGTLSKIWAKIRAV